MLIFDGGGPASRDLAELRSLLRQRSAPIALCAASPDADLPLPQLPEALAAIAATVRAQQFALALTLVRGRNPDAPGGLSKVTLTH